MQTKSIPWRVLALQTGMIAAAVVSLALVTATVLRAFFPQEPPVFVTSMDESYLGVLCPGDEMFINNKLTVERAPVVLFYYVSTMDETETYNFFLTQHDYAGFPHPRTGSFPQVVPWAVPNLPPGDYARVMAIRGTDGDEIPLIVSSGYSIGENCNE